MKHYPIILCSLALTLLPLQAVKLAEDGKAFATIIVPENASPVTKQAADNLTRYLHQISGAKFSITDNPKSVETESRIWVGMRQELHALVPQEELAFRHPEEIYIRALESDLIMMGRDHYRAGVQVEAGTHLAVSTYLQDHLGVRWLWPGELGTHIPKEKNLEVEPFTYRYHPLLRWRELRGVNAMRQYDGLRQVLPIPGVKDLASVLNRRDREVREWLHFQKADHSPPSVPGSPLRGSLTFNAGHAYSSWWERFHEKHPEWFALQPDGTRGPFPNPKDVKINPSNPEVAAQWLKDAKVFFSETNPERLMRSAAENDRGWQGYCVCETCLSWDSKDAPILWNRALAWANKREENPRALTDRYVKYWNILARELKEMFPDRELYVSVMAYNPMRPAPVREKLEENIAVAFEGIHERNPIGNNRKDEAVAREMWKQWAEMANMIVWRPNLIHQTAGLPYVFPRRHAENMRFLADHKMVGISVDSIGNHWATQGPMYYVVAQLAWNPYLDVNELLDDYYRSAFGPGAEFVRAYFESFEKLYEDFAEDYHEAGWHRSRDLPKLYRERYTGENKDRTKRLGMEGVVRNHDLERSAAALLAKAKEAVAKEPEIYRKRIEFIEKGLAFTTLQLDCIQAMNDLREGQGKRNELWQVALNAHEKRKSFLEREFGGYAIAYGELLRSQLLGAPGDFGPPRAKRGTESKSAETTPLLLPEEETP